MRDQLIDYLLINSIGTMISQSCFFTRGLLYDNKKIMVSKIQIKMGKC